MINDFLLKFSLTNKLIWITLFWIRFVSWNWNNIWILNLVQHYENYLGYELLDSLFGRKKLVSNVLSGADTVIISSSSLSWFVSLFSGSKFWRWTFRKLKMLKFFRRFFFSFRHFLIMNFFRIPTFAPQK